MTKIVYAKEYQILPGVLECQMAAIRRMLSENPENVCFRFEPGQYHIYKENAIKRPFVVSNSDQTGQRSFGVFLEQMQDVTLDGQGAEFIFHGDMTPLCVTECKNVKIANMAFDAATPLSAEAVVEKTEPGAIEVSLDGEHFPYHVEDGTLIFEREYGETGSLFGIMEFDPESGRVPDDTGDAYNPEKVFELEKNKIRLEGKFRTLPKIGNILVLRNGKRVHPGGLVQFSENITLENVKVHQTGGLGIVFQFNENIHASGVAFVPNKKRGMKILSGHDDGLHFSNNKGSITVEHCEFRGLMDDPINVHGTAAAVVRRENAQTLRGEFRHHQSVGFDRWAKAGDVIGFINPQNRKCFAKGTVISYRLLTPEEFEICFEESVPVEVLEGYAMENLTYTPSVVCRDNYFGGARARGILITTPKSVRIENNTFESSGSAIVLSGDVKDWYESGTCTDVEIRGNKFIKCCTSSYQFSDAVIHIEPSVDPEQEEIVHHNIRIVDNLFLLAGTGVLYADHTGDILLEGNRIQAENYEYVQPMVLKKCAEVHARGNELHIGKK